MIIVLTFFFLLVPVLILFLTERVSVLNKIGAIIIAYAVGLVIGHIGLLHKPGEFLETAMQIGTTISSDQLNSWLVNGMITLEDVTAYKIFMLQDTLVSIVIPVALPLLLFSLKIKVWFRMSGITMLSMLLAIVAAVGIISVGYYLFKEDFNSAEKLAGMMVGLYTGGTPNLASLKEMLDVDANTYIMVHTYDTAVGVIYLLFIITIGKHIFRGFLKPYPKLTHTDLYENITFNENAYQDFFSKKNLRQLGIALGLSIAIVGLSGGLSFLFPPSQLMLVVILTITTLSIAASFVPKINKLEKSFELGMYFIIVFSLVVATMADIQKLISISGSLFLYISIVVFGTLVLHALFSKIFRVDADTFMVTSTALICSPPFVPMVAGPLKNKEVIVSGLTVGIMGYAIGNYLGITLAALLK